MDLYIIDDLKKLEGKTIYVSWLEGYFSHDRDYRVILTTDGGLLIIEYTSNYFSDNDNDDDNDNEKYALILKHPSQIQKLLVDDTLVRRILLKKDISLKESIDKFSKSYIQELENKRKLEKEEFEKKEFEKFIKLKQKYEGK